MTKNIDVYFVWCFSSQQRKIRAWCVRFFFSFFSLCRSLRLQGLFSRLIIDSVTILNAGFTQIHMQWTHIYQHACTASLLLARSLSLASHKGFSEFDISPEMYLYIHPNRRYGYGHACKAYTQWNVKQISGLDAKECIHVNGDGCVRTRCACIGICG